MTVIRSRRAITAPRVQTATQRVGSRRARTQRPRSAQPRIKISITLSPALIVAVDEEARAHGTSRSRVIDAVLAAWCAEQRRQALVRQYTMPPTPAQPEEQAAWDAILDAAAADLLTDAGGR